MNDPDVSQRPRLRLRVLDHRDNLDGSIERGHAGRSPWNWKAPPGAPGSCLRDDACANAIARPWSTQGRWRRRTKPPRITVRLMDRAADERCVCL
jgi:Glycosyl hydrolase family 67 middle domain